MDINLDSAREAFDASTDFTVGIEEEFALLDPRDLGLTGALSRISSMRRSADPVLAESIAGELISSEIEIRSGRGEDLAAAIAAQRDRRRRLFALADEHHVALGASRHPSVVGLPRAAHHRDRALPPGRGWAEVRRVA